MAASYLHGVETVEIPSKGGLIRLVKSSIIVLLGVSPAGPSQALTLCNNDTDDAQFGGIIKGSNIGRTLDIIRKLAGSCAVVVINCYNQATHTTAKTSGDAEVIALVDGMAQMSLPPVGTVTITNNATSSAIAGTKGIDWDYDANGLFRDITGTLAGLTLKFSYTGFDESKVQASHLVGTVNGTTGVRTGAKLIETMYSKYGFTAKVIVCPQYSSLSAVAAELRSQADKARAVWLHDAPFGTTVSDAVAGRGNSGTIGWNINHARTILLYPYLKVDDPITNAKINYPYSAFMAAMIVKTDFDFGYWYSPSNKSINIVTEAERTITSGVSDAGSEANLLNASGIVTYFSDYGTGLRTWGNRTAAYPSSNSAKAFINVQRVDDIVSESLEIAALNYVDRPINNALIDVIKQEGNALIASLIQRGALLPGSQLKYDAAKNSPDELAAGHITFTRIYMVPVPGERITLESYLDIDLYKFVNKAATA